MQDVPLPQLAVMMLLGSIYLGKLLLCQRASLSFEPLTSSFACVVVVICRVQEACHHHVSTYIMYVGKVGGTHRTSYPFHSFCGELLCAEGMSSAFCTCSYRLCGCLGMESWSQPVHAVKLLFLY